MKKKEKKKLLLGGFLALGIVLIVLLASNFSIFVGGEQSYEVGDVIAGTVGLTGSASGANDGDAKFSIEVKQIDGTWRTAWSDEYSQDLRITFTNTYPNIYNDVWKDYGRNVACDNGGTWGYRARDGVLVDFSGDGCYSYIPRLRQGYQYYYRYAEGIMFDFTANDVQEDGTIIYKNVVTAETSGGSFGVGINNAWNLVDNPNPKQCSDLEYDADLENNKYRQCGADGYWTDYVVCSSNEKLVFVDKAFVCEIVEEVVVDNQTEELTDNVVIEELDAPPLVKDGYEVQVYEKIIKANIDYYSYLVTGTIECNDAFAEKICTDEDHNSFFSYDCDSDTEKLDVVCRDKAPIIGSSNGGTTQDSGNSWILFLVIFVAIAGVTTARIMLDKKKKAGKRRKK